MAADLPPICILAGGLGTRLGSLVRATPKPLLPVAGRPFLLHQLELLAQHGARRAVICTGYRGEMIRETLGDRQFGITLCYSDDGPTPIGTLGAVRKAAPLLDERFLILYGDTYLRLDYRAAACAWLESGLPAMMTVLRNEGRWDASNAVFANQRVTAYDKRLPTPEMRWIDYGLGGLTNAAVMRSESQASDLADLYRRLAREGDLFGWLAAERFYEIGTPEALAETTAFLQRPTEDES